MKVKPIVWIISGFFAAGILFAISKMNSESIMCGAMIITQSILYLAEVIDEKGSKGDL